VSLAEDYRGAVAELAREQTTFELLPLALVRACVRVLPVDGAGVSVTERLRVPLAASDPVVAVAERLQTTLGEGPCLSAAATGTALVAGQHEIERWPIFSHELSAATPFRSLAAVPLRLPGEQPFGALDLYSTDPDPGRFGPLEELEVAVAGPAAALLMEAPNRVSSEGLEMPVWLDNDRANDRMDVWVAVGMMMATGGVGNDDALAVLRGYAYGHELSLDEVAHRMLTGELSVSDVRPQPT